MYTGSFLTVLVTSYLFVSSGAQHITTCPDSHIDVEENKITTMRCEDFDDMDTVIWLIGEHNSVLAPLATCKPTPSCVVTNGVVGVDRKLDNGKAYSWLQLNMTRSRDKHLVVCKKQSPPDQESMTKCMLNVIGSTTGTATNSPHDADPNNAPVGAIVGGAVAACVVVIVIVVVVVVVVIVRKKMERSGKDASREQVHYNPENGTGVVLEPSQNDDDDDAYAGPPEVGIYAFPGGDEPATIPDNTPAAEDDDVGMYAAPKQDVYTAVDKSKPKKNKPATSDHPVTSQAATVADEYAVVSKASKRKEASNSTGLSEVHIPADNDASAAPAPYIYAQVNKTSKPAKTAVSVSSTPEEEGATYAQVQKPKKK